MATSIHDLRRTLDSTRGRGPADWTGDLAPVFLLLWVASIARVIIGVRRHETFGALPTLALLAIVLLPLLLRGQLRRRPR